MKRACLLGFLVTTSLASAEIKYTVEVKPDAGMLHVVMQIPNTNAGAKLQIPNWAPGAYMLRDSFKQVQNLKAKDGSGRDLAIRQDITISRRFYTLPSRQDVALNEVCTWTVAPAKDTTIEYDIPSRFTGSVTHWSGPSTYMYEVDRKEEKCLLTVRVPAGWQVFNGLDERAPMVFTAPDYDVLADNPVTAGSDVLVDTYTVLGKKHTIVMRGAPKSQVDRAKLIKACQHVTEMETHFFGNEAPYKHYVWHFDVNGAPDGAGGLEHLSSTQITLAAGVGPRAVSVLSHEFFHLWNVKRIRSRVLGPFDYQKLPSTGALWWLEGVTDYYASYLLYRSGWTTEKDLFSQVNRLYQNVSRNSAFGTVSANEASLRMPETNNGRGNSNGYLLSYYDLGWLAGMCLDLNLRHATGGRHSLDDVTRALWKECRDNQPGFPEDEIRNQYVRLGGSAEAYDRIVNQPNMPVPEALALGGLKVGTEQVPFTDLGFTWSMPGPGVTALVVMEAHGPAAGKLMARDTLISINGKKIEGNGPRGLGEAIRAATEGAEVGKPMKVVVQREGKEQEFEITPSQGQRETTVVSRNADADNLLKAIGAGWLKQEN